jgi:hypothetical protein
MNNAIATKYLVFDFTLVFISFFIKGLSSAEVVPEVVGYVFALLPLLLLLKNKFANFKNFAGLYVLGMIFTTTAFNNATPLYMLIIFKTGIALAFTAAFHGYYYEED